MQLCAINRQVLFHQRAGSRLSGQPRGILDREAHASSLSPYGGLQTLSCFPAAGSSSATCYIRSSSGDDSGSFLEQTRVHRNDIRRAASQSASAHGHAYLIVCGSLWRTRSIVESD